MRNKIIVGLTTALTAASIAGPAMAASAPSVPAGANSPQLHVSTCTVKKSPKGYVYATCPLTAINVGNQTIYVSYASNMKTFEPVTGGQFGAQRGVLGVPGTSKVQNVYSLRFAFKNRSVAQVRKSLKVTISNPTGGALITAGTATA
jgi:hypothetical protein